MLCPEEGKLMTKIKFLPYFGVVTKWSLNSFFFLILEKLNLLSHNKQCTDEIIMWRNLLALNLSSNHDGASRMYRILFGAVKVNETSSMPTESQNFS